MKEREELRRWLTEMPVVAILRGVTPENVAATARALFDKGVRIMEVPLNVPHAKESIALMCEEVGAHALIGGGTIRTVEDLSLVANAGGRLAVMPHLDAALVIGALDVGLIPVPGVFTPSEAFAALDAGAAALKLFPAEVLTTKGLAAWRSVMSREEALLIPTGGVSAQTVAEWWHAGADGFGVGSAVFDPGGDVAETKARAESFIAAVNHARNGEISV